MGELIALLSTLLYALSGVAVARSAAARHKGDHGALLSMILTVAFSLPIWLLSRPAPSAGQIDTSSFWLSTGLFALAGIFSTGLGRITNFRSVILLGPVHASMLRRLTPVFVAVFAIMLFGAFPSALQTAGFALILVSAALIGGPGRMSSGRHPAAPAPAAPASLGVIIGLTSAVSYALAYILRDVALGHVPAAAYGAFIGGMTGLILYAAIGLHRNTPMIATLRLTRGWQLLAATALAGGQVLQFYALARTSATNVAMINSLETLANLLFAYFLFPSGARLDRRLLAAIAISLIGMVMIAMP